MRRTLRAGSLGLPASNNCIVDVKTARCLPTKLTGRGKWKIPISACFRHRHHSGDSGKENWCTYTNMPRSCIEASELTALFVSLRARNKNDGRASERKAASAAAEAHYAAVQTREQTRASKVDVREFFSRRLSSFRLALGIPRRY